MMKIKHKIKYETNKGAAMMVLVLFFVFISLTILIGIVTPTVREYEIVSRSFNSKKAYVLAESGIEDVFYRVKNNKKVSSTQTLSIGSDTTTTTITNVGSTQKQINSLGDSRSNQRKVSLVLGIGDGVVFKYGSQSGQGGVIFKNNSFLNGNLYSNGNIIGENGAYITGDAFVSGSTGLISNMRVGYGSNGAAYAHTINNSTVTGGLFCQAGSGNNKICDNSQPDPIVVDLPVSEENIASWEKDASDGGVISGDKTISSPTTLGPVKINGNLVVNNTTLTIKNTIWVTGNLSIIGTRGAVKLDSSYGANSGIIIADGLISTENGVTFQDSGTAGSYIMLLSKSSCDETMLTSPCLGKNAIEISNNSNIVIANAQKGTVNFSNNATVKEVVGNTIRLKNNVGITYGTGLINVGFTSGPAGSWTINSWKESK